MVKLEFFESYSLDILKREVNDYLKNNNLRMDQIGKIYYNKVLTEHTSYKYRDIPYADVFSYSVMIVIDNWKEMLAAVPEGTTKVPEPLKRDM
jgi:hypothetical protein